jgi:hypothetical protein
MRSLAFYLSDELKQKSREQRFFNTILHQVLPAPLNQHVWAAGVDSGVLKLQTDSPVWATQLRYQQHELIKQLNTDPAIHLRKCQIAVSQRRIDRFDQQTRLQKLSSSAKKSIKSSTATLSDPELKALFEKIANR